LYYPPQPLDAIHKTLLGVLSASRIGYFNVISRGYLLFVAYRGIFKPMSFRQFQGDADRLRTSGGDGII
jgi:hypothetical protein